MQRFAEVLVNLFENAVDAKPMTLSQPAWTCANTSPIEN